LGHISTINRISAVSHAIRISLIGFVLLLPVTAWSLTGIVTATATAVLVNVLLYQRALRTHGIEDSRLDRADRKRVDQQVVTIARPLVLSAIFFQFQGVITVFLVSLFGTADMLAEVGAFSRLAIVLMVADRVTNTLLFPALARAPVGPRLAWMVTRVHAVYLGMMLLVLLSAWFGAHWWILLLGEKYRSVEPYVWMVFMASILLNASSLAFRTLTVRGLTAKQAYIIPVILAVQVLYLWLVGVTDLRSVLTLNIATCLAHFAYQYTLLGLRMSQMREQA